jgi:hypothetical protein
MERVETELALVISRPLARHGAWHAASDALRCCAARIASRLGALALVLACASAAASGEAQGSSRASMQRAWAALDHGERAEVAQWFQAECAQLGGEQVRVRKQLLAALPVERGLLPRRGDAPHYDSAQHAPAQPIPRTVLDAQDPLAQAARASFLRSGSDSLRCAYAYDWATREIVIVGEEDDPELVFHNALLGLAPLADLAQAIALRALDRGEEARTFEAFGHAYTDRLGNVYPEVTLYDAWSSGAEMEMPDVDVLGLVHSLGLKRDKRWKAPIPTSQHASLYAAVGKPFTQARRYRVLREALAQLALRSRPALPQGYEVQAEALHALWAHTVNAQGLAQALPPSGQELEFVSKWSRQLSEVPARRSNGIDRLTALDHGERAVYALLQKVLSEFGALERAGGQGSPPR